MRRYANNYPSRQEWNVTSSNDIGITCRVSSLLTLGETSSTIKMTGGMPLSAESKRCARRVTGPSSTYREGTELLAAMAPVGEE